MSDNINWGTSKQYELMIPTSKKFIKKYSSHYIASVSHCNQSDGEIVWRFCNRYDDVVPQLRLLLFDFTSGILIVEDDSMTQKFKWQRSTNNCKRWSKWDNINKNNDNTYLRITIDKKYLNHKKISFELNEYDDFNKEETIIDRIC